MFKKAGLDPENPPLKTYDEFLATSKKIVDSKAAPAAIQPSPSSEFFQSWFDFYPLYAAESGGKQTIEDGKATFNDEAGKDVWNFWAQMYEEGYTPQEKYDGDAFADKKAAMAVVGPWAIAVYKGKVNWGVVPVPTKEGMDASEVHTFSDAKNIGLYSACENQKTAWDVLKFATSEDQDAKLLETTGQMPIRKDLATTYADYFKSHPDYKTFADQASRTVEVPNVPNSVEIWQEIRDNFSSAVIFAKTSVDESITAPRTRLTSSPASPDAVRPALTQVFGRQPLGTVFAAPYALFLALVFAYPLGLAVWISFHDYFFAAPGAQVDRPFVGFDNYAAVLADPDVRRPFVNVAVFLVINVPLTVVLSLVLATGAELGHAGAHVPARLLLRALRDGQRRAGGGVAVPVQLRAVSSTRSSARWRRRPRGWSTASWRCRSSRCSSPGSSSASSSCSTWRPCRACRRSCTRRRRSTGRAGSAPS